MPNTYTDTAVTSLIINKLTQEQYDSLPVKSDTELYLIDGGETSVYAEQMIEMPVASADNASHVVQYIGTTDTNYTQGYFYRCVSSGVEPNVTYAWTQIDVQPASGGSPLPSQTGQAGKFLVTDGTNASWSDVTNRSKVTLRTWSDQ